MATQRIKSQPGELRDQLQQAAAAITAAGSAWPSGAPTATTITTAATVLDTHLDAVADLEARLAEARSARKASSAAGVSLMRQVDRWTDSLYGPRGAEKSRFGLAPRATGTAPLGIPPRLTDIRLTDGTAPTSLRLAFESVHGGTYEVEWFTDSALIQRVGSAASTTVKVTITGLTKGTQYWVRVRVLRGGQVGPWSNPATRIANV